MTITRCARKSCEQPATVPFLPHCSADCALIARSVARLPGICTGKPTMGHGAAVVQAFDWLDARADS